jgi:hypothetical protein
VVILRDVQVAQPHLTVVDGRERIGKRRLTLAQALHLGADQLNSSLVGVEYRIVVPRFAIRRHNLVIGGPRRVGFLRHGYLRT